MNKKTIIIIAVTVLIVVILAGALVWFQKSKSPVSVNETTAAPAVDSAADSANNAIEKTAEDAANAVKNLPNTNPYKKVNPF